MATDDDRAAFMAALGGMAWAITEHARTADSETDWRYDFAEGARAVLVETGYVQSGRPGGFVRALIEALMNADATNRALLSAGFPALAGAVVLYKDHADGVAILQRLAGVPETEH